MLLATLGATPLWEKSRIKVYNCGDLNDCPLLLISALLPAELAEGQVFMFVTASH